MPLLRKSTHFLRDLIRDDGTPMPEVLALAMRLVSKLDTWTIFGLHILHRYDSVDHGE